MAGIVVADAVTRRRIGLGRRWYSVGDAFGREPRISLHWMGRRHHLAAERLLVGSSESPESEVDGASEHQTG